MGRSQMCGAKRHIPQRHRRIDLCSHSEGIDLLARGNMRIHIVDDLAHARGLRRLLHQVEDRSQWLA
jgi:hypothetical protein